MRKLKDLLLWCYVWYTIKAYDGYEYAMEFKEYLNKKRGR